MSKFISMMWSEGVLEEESEVFAQTVDGVLKWLFLRHPRALMDPPIRIHLYGNWVIPALVPNTPYWGTQWYIDMSFDNTLQRVIAPVFLELVRQEPWQRADPHFDLALLDQDLTDFPAPLARLRPDHYALGTSLPGTTAVMSLHRVRTLTEAHVRALALARLVRHHLGHVMGIPSFGRSASVQRRGLELHCTNRCVMRHAETVGELAALAIEEDELGWPFCELCTQDLHTVVVRQLYNWN
ncbi:MAG TPA: hypothetical protein GX714_13525 [Chloroflexi bacterium]|jgi:hypothetical protein|nr:hypothetical protein [Chloroflexota bacterium]